MHYAIACDPERGGREILGIVSKLAASDDRVTVVHVVNPLDEPWSDRKRDLPDAVAAVIADQRTAIRTLLDEVGLTAAVQVQSTEPGEETASAVARVARTLSAGTLVVLSKRASGPRGMLFGSVAQGLLALSPCPVLVVRPGEGRDGGADRR